MRPYYLCVMLFAAVAASAANADELTDTAWRLVNISSMDDTVYRPDDPARYTLEFESGGGVSIEADCNHGSGTWSSESPGQLQFEQIATTRAMCQPDSISEKYLAQFAWVRTYVLREGHLFLATMADGAIIEFAPDKPEDSAEDGPSSGESSVEQHSD